MKGIIRKLNPFIKNNDILKWEYSFVYEFHFDGKKLFFNAQPSLELIAGRDENCDIVIEHNSVSRQHARILCEHGSLWVEDLGSKNGTFIKGKRISEKTELVDEFVLGCVPIKIRRKKNNQRRERISKLYALLSLISSILTLAGGAILFVILMDF